jgi:hypothetical protein
MGNGATLVGNTAPLFRGVRGAPRWSRAEMGGDGSTEAMGRCSR